MDSRSNILLNKNEIQELRLQNKVGGATLPPAGWKGGLIFNSTDNRVYSYIGVDTLTQDTAWGQNWKTWLYKGEAKADLTLTAGRLWRGQVTTNIPEEILPSAISLSELGKPTGDVSWKTIGGVLNKIIDLKNPDDAQDAATKFYVDTGDNNLKTYVDNLVQGLKIHDSCLCLTVGELVCSYSANVLTGTGNGPLPPALLDNVTPIVGSRILVKNQAISPWNGIYVVTQLGVGGYSPWKLTRASDADTGAELLSAFVFIQQGTNFHDTGWVQTEETTALGWVIGTGAITWIQFSGSGTYVAGNGMVLSGNAFNFCTASPYTVGSLFYANSTSTVGQLVPGTQYSPLIGDPTAPVYSPNWRMVNTGLLEFKALPSGLLGQLQFNAPLTLSRLWTLPDYSGFIPATDVRSPGQYRMLLSGPLNSGPAVWSGYAVPLNATADRLLHMDSAGLDAKWDVQFPSLKAGTLVPAVVARKFEKVVPGEASTTITVAHDLNTRKVQVTLRYSADAADSDVAREILYTQTDVMSVNTVRFTFATIQPTSKYYAVTIVG